MYDASLGDVPATFEGFRDRHAGGTILVCGLGTSLNQLAEPERFVTIGVNDIGRRFTPDYLLVLNSRSQFPRERFAFIENSRASALFSHMRLDVPHPNQVRVPLGSYAAPDFKRREKLAHTRNSPYVAVCLAVYMGARRIGLIGVDFTNDHFFANTGAHSLSGQVPRIDKEYEHLARACAEIGTELVYLSPNGRLGSLRRMSLGEFAGTAKSARSLNIVSYATTPVAGVPDVLTRCIQARTPHLASTVWPRAGYGNGVEFGGGIESGRDPAAARRALEGADLVVVHNGFVAQRDRALIDSKPTLTLAHNYKWNVDDRYVVKGAPGLVVAQYQASLPEFAGWIPVPQPMPLWEEAFCAGPKGETVTIAYTPSGRHERYPPGHRLYWHAKGYDTTIAVLDRLAARHGIRVETVRSRQVSHAESLAMKRRAHIVIDECVTGSYHRNSLEGLAAGAVVVNGLGLVDDIAAVFRACAGEAPNPFVQASLADLEGVLEGLIAEGREALEERGRAGRAWIERHWNFHRQWNETWLPAVARALGEPSRAAPRRAMPAREMASEGVSVPRSGEVTVVIPHRGDARLPLLDACLEQLRRVEGIAKVLVVELDEAPLAHAIAERHGAEHLYCRADGAFDKARALNLATPFLCGDYVLWLDGDILLPPGFVTAAVAESGARRLDSLTPWFHQHYLSEFDSAAVRSGCRAPSECVPVHVARSGGGWTGAAELVRKDFLLKYGGVPSGFLGWGCEDNAWQLKARLLGSHGASRDEGQLIFHLFHPESNGNARGVAMRANPHYQRNLSLLRRMQAVRGRAAYLRQFPPPEHHLAPWEGVRRVACAPGTEAAGEALRRLFGPAVTLAATGEPCDLVLSADWGRDGEAVALEAARRLSGCGQARPPATAPAPGSVPDVAMAAGPMTHARKAHLNLPEFRAVRRLSGLPRARAWELPYVLAHGRIRPGGRVIDRSADPVALDRLVALSHPHATYLYRPALAEGDFLLALDVPDGTADTVACVNTLENLPDDRRAALMADMARLLRPGGRLVVTCDYHFDSFLRRPRRPPELADARQVPPAEIGRLASEAGLHPLDQVPPPPEEADIGLFRNIEPCPHAVTGMVFRKPGAAEAALPVIALALMPGHSDAELAFLRSEAAALLRLGHGCVLLHPAGKGGERAVYDREVSMPASTEPDAVLAAYMAAARKASAAALFRADPGTFVPPLLPRALWCCLENVSGGIAGLSYLADDPGPVLALRVGGPAEGTARLTLRRVPSTGIGALGVFHAAHPAA